MFRKNSTFIFVLLGVIATGLALYFSFFLAAILLPPDVLYQSIFSIFSFLFAAAYLLFLVASRFYIGSEAQGKNFKNRIFVGSACINITLLFVFVLLIYFGYATPRETLIFCCVLLVLLLALLKKFVLE